MKRGNLENMEGKNLGDNRRGFLKKTFIGLSYFAGKDVVNAMPEDVKDINSNKIESEGSEKLVLSWSTLNGKMPVEKLVQKIVSEKFSGLANVIWREADLASEQSNQVQVICLPDLKPERMLQYGIITTRESRELAGCTPKSTGQIRFDNRIFVSLEGVKVVLKNNGVPITPETFRHALASAVAHEIIHVVLGTSQPHSKKGLFSAKLDYGTKIDPEIQEQFRREIINNKSPLVSMDSIKDNLPQ